jgi:hypothetical protein
MQELGIPDEMNGEPDYDGDGWRQAFNPFGRQGGGCVTGVVVDSGVLNPELLKGKKGPRLYPRMRLRDRIDSAIAHEYEELRHSTHGEALKAAAETKLPIRDEARRLNRAMARSSARRSAPGNRAPSIHHGSASFLGAGDKLGLPLESLLREAVNRVPAPDKAMSACYQPGALQLGVSVVVSVYVNLAVPLDVQPEQGQGSIRNSDTPHGYLHLGSYRDLPISGMPVAKGPLPILVPAEIGAFRSDGPLKVPGPRSIAR